MGKIKIIGYNQATVANDFVELFRTHTQSINIIEPDDFLQGKYNDNDQFVIAITRDLNLRKQLITTLDNRLLSRATLVHQTCVIDKQAEINDGSVIYPFVSALWHSTIERDCLVGPYCMIAHQSRLGQGSFMQPGAMIAGSTTIGSMCMLGMRSSVIDKLSICDWVETGATSLITKNITQPGLYLGQPARRVNTQQ